ncbi:threonine/serine exporter family protein [Nocardia sp. JMUB6875]|uniref:threonine/serine exporter family protein n=1 Tax=Nocardia sp. JMUB6875 TaxID=3158170 RepID=UPI0034E84803
MSETSGVGPLRRGADGVGSRPSTADIPGPGTPGERVPERPVPYRAWVADLGIVPIGVGLCLIMQPAVTTVITAGAGSFALAQLATAARRSTVLRALLPVLAPLLIGCSVLAAEHAGLLSGPRRTVAAVVVLLPGALIVTGLSERLSAAAVAGTAQPLRGVLRIGVFTAGLSSAAIAVLAAPSRSAIAPTDHLDWWAPWLGLLVLWAGACVNIYARGEICLYIFAIMVLTFLVQTATRLTAGPATAGFAGALTAVTAAALLGRLNDGPNAQVVLQPSCWLLAPGSLSQLGRCGHVTPYDSHLPASVVASLLSTGSGIIVAAALCRSTRSHR